MFNFKLVGLKRIQKQRFSICVYKCCHLYYNSFSSLCLGYLILMMGKLKLFFIYFSSRRTVSSGTTSSKWQLNLS